jgi:hypothetical protein
MHNGLDSYAEKAYKSKGVSHQAVCKQHLKSRRVSLATLGGGGGGGMLKLILPKKKLKILKTTVWEFFLFYFSALSRFREVVTFLTLKFFNQLIPWEVTLYWPDGRRDSLMSCIFLGFSKCFLNACKNTAPSSCLLLWNYLQILTIFCYQFRSCLLQYSRELLFWVFKHHGNQKGAHYPKNIYW